ncbi:Sensor protein PhoQ [compost metagenome]
MAVTAVRCDGFIRVVVEDDGPGVSPERLPDLLRRGVRLDRLKPGSGLGLAIVSEIANVYNLALTLENRVEGGLRAAVTCSDPLASPETGCHGKSQ